MIRRLFFLCLLWLLPQTASAQADPETALARAFDQAVAEQRLPGAVLIVVGRDGVRFTRAAGSITADRPVAVASASKWMAAALVMTLVDEGRLSLDTRVGAVLPNAPTPMRDATVRQLFSHTAGSGGAEILAVANVSSTQDAVDQLFAGGFRRPPGQSFAYGGTSMQIGALMAERAGGASWTQMFDRRIAGPLGFSGHRWGWLRRNGAADVPLAAGGLTVSARDYAAFLRMILNEGQMDGRRILSAAAIREMERNQTGTLPIHFAPAATPPGWRYGLGIWCERQDAAGRCLVSSSAGAFGTYPWIDRERGLAGIFVTLARLDTALPAAIALRERATELLAR